MSDLGGLTLVPYGLPGPNGDTELLIWPLPLIYVKTAMTQVLDFLWDQIVHSPVDFSYKWRRFHRTPYGLAEPGDSGLWQTLSRGTIYLKTAMTQVLDFLWGSIQYEDIAFLGLIEMDLWGPLRPGKISGHGLSQYSFQGTIYAKSAMTQVLVILGGFSENRFFGTFQIL